MSERKALDAFGRRGRSDYVRVIRERAHDTSRIRVLWKDSTGRKVESFPDTRAGIADAKRYAEAMHEELRSPALPAPAPSGPAPLTLRELYAAYVDAHVMDWRPKSRVGNAERWGKFELFADRETMASRITRETLDRFKAQLVGAGHSVNQVKHYIQTAVRVFRFGVDRDLIPPTKVTQYVVRFGRDLARQQAVMAEYSKAERERLLAQWSPRDPRHWRAWVLTTLLSYNGPRENAALRLTWDDVDLEGERVRWQAAHDKMGRERWQPMPKPVVDAMWVAYGWRLAREYTGPFVFFSPQPKRQNRAEPWSYSAYNAALHVAEAQADVETIKYRAAHGFRRGISGDVFDATGSEKMAAEWVGDQSLRIVRDRYLLTRDDRLRRTADIVGQEDRPNG